MFVVKVHRLLTGETREFVNDIYGPFKAWGAASDYANAYCSLWKEERATATIEWLYEPSAIILARAERERPAPDWRDRYGRPLVEDAPAPAPCCEYHSTGGHPSLSCGGDVFLGVSDEASL
jgi:hypothetical protein